MRNEFKREIGNIEWHLSNVYFYLSAYEGRYGYTKDMALHSFNIIKKYVEGCLKKDNKEEDKLKEDKTND